MLAVVSSPVLGSIGLGVTLFSTVSFAGKILYPIIVGVGSNPALVLGAGLPSVAGTSEPSVLDDVGPSVLDNVVPERRNDYRNYGATADNVIYYRELAIYYWKYIGFGGK